LKQPFVSPGPLRSGSVERRPAPSVYKPVAIQPLQLKAPVSHTSLRPPVVPPAPLVRSAPIAYSPVRPVVFPSTHGLVHHPNVVQQTKGAWLLGGLGGIAVAAATVVTGGIAALAATPVLAAVAVGAVAGHLAESWLYPAVNTRKVVETTGAGWQAQTGVKKQHHSRGGRVGGGKQRTKYESAPKAAFVPRPEITQADREDVAEYQRLIQLERDQVVSQQHNREADRWRQDSTRNLNRAPSPLNGGTVDISDFLAVAGGAGRSGYSTRPYHNQEGVLVGGAVRARVYTEIRTKGHSRVIVGHGVHRYFTNGGTHRVIAGHESDVRNAWWVHWDGARWWHWNAWENTDVEFPRAERVVEDPLSAEEVAELRRLSQTKNNARRGHEGFRHLQTLWQNA
jgi:hypothetical protein